MNPRTNAWLPSPTAESEASEQASEQANAFKFQPSKVFEQRVSSLGVPATEDCIKPAHFTRCSPKPARCDLEDVDESTPRDQSGQQSRYVKLGRCDADCAIQGKTTPDVHVHVHGKLDLASITDKWDLELSCYKDSFAMNATMSQVTGHTQPKKHNLGPRNREPK